MWRTWALLGALLALLALSTASAAQEEHHVTRRIQPVTQPTPSFVSVARRMRQNEEERGIGDVLLRGYNTVARSILSHTEEKRVKPDTTHLVRHPLDISLPKGLKMNVFVKTMHHNKASAAGQAYIRFIDQLGGRSDWYHLNNKWIVDQLAKETAEYTIELSHGTFGVAGIELAVTKGIRGALMSNPRWGLSDIWMTWTSSRTKKTEAIRIPANTWIHPGKFRRKGKHLVMTTHTKPAKFYTGRLLVTADALLPQKYTHPLKRLVKADLAYRRERWAWEDDEKNFFGKGFAGHLKHVKDKDGELYVPEDDRFDSAKLWAFTKLYVLDQVNQMFGKLKGVFSSNAVPALKKYEDLWIGTEKGQFKYINRDPKVWQRVKEDWWRDDEFGRQAMNGVNPNQLHRLVTIPKRLDGKLPGEFVLKLEKLIEKEELFMLDYSMLHEALKGKTWFNAPMGGVDTSAISQMATKMIAKFRKLFGKEKDPKNIRRYVYPALCLLQFFPEEDELRPIAIQLSIDGKVMLAPSRQEISLRERKVMVSQKKPSKSKFWCWLQWKNFVGNADSHVHQIVTHYVKTHGVIEAISIALQRSFGGVHPLYQLLRPHMSHTVHINVLARQSLLIPDGLIARIFSASNDFLKVGAQGYKNWRFIDEHPLRKLESNNIKPKHLGGQFHYRDDVIRVMAIIHKYVASVVKEFYKTVDDMKKDDELANFMREMHEHGFPGEVEVPVDSSPSDNDKQTLQQSTEKRSTQTKKVPRWPAHFESIDELIDYVSTIIYVSSTSHSAVNFGQMDIYGYIPNKPSLMRRPPCEADSEITDSEYVKALPTLKQSRLQIGTNWLLSSFEKNERYLADIGHEDFFGKVMYEKHAPFRKELQALSDEMEERNRKLRTPYIYADPVKTSTISIAI